MKSGKSFIALYSIKFLGAIIRKLPINVALMIGRMIGMLAYYLDIKHKSQAYRNLRQAFANTKSPEEIKRITKDLFRNYGQNFIELLRMPLMNAERFKEFVKIEGQENIDESLKEGKGVILLAMHFGSWEMASLSCGLLGYPYKMFVNPQTKNSKLDSLLNSYRSCGGSVMLSRGAGTRDFVRSLKNNEVIGMVVDQGGKDGVLMSFLGREASMSVGAIRMGLKMGVPLCFSVIIREKGAQHYMKIHKPFKLIKTGDQEKNIRVNLKKVVQLMEQYVNRYPSEYMWFHKIWKYAKQANIGILSDKKVGHVRQSEAVKNILEQALYEREIKCNTQIAEVCYKNKWAKYCVQFISVFYCPLLMQGRFGFLRWFLTEESFVKVSSLKVDYVISCGSSVASINFLLSRDYKAKSIVILKPGILDFKKFDLVFLPEHDRYLVRVQQMNITFLRSAPNLINKKYLDEQSQLLLNRFSHLKTNCRYKIGIFIGGNSSKVYLSDKQIKILIRQVQEIARELNASILVTTSRRTPRKIEQYLYRKLKKNPLCPLLILANQDNVPEAVGGIMGLSDILITSGDSISMVSESASSGKSTIVFLPEERAKVLKGVNKHKHFVETLNEKGFVRSSKVKNIGQCIYDIVKNKAYTRKLDDSKVILEAIKKIV